MKVKDKGKRKEQATQCNPEIASIHVQTIPITLNEEDENETLSQSSQGSMADDLTGWNNTSITDKTMTDIQHFLTVSLHCPCK